MGPHGQFPGKHYEAVLTDLGLRSCKTLTSFVVAPQELREDATAPLDEADASTCKRAAGCLVGMAQLRPGLSFLVKELARSLQTPAHCSYQVLKRLGRRLAGTAETEWRLDLVQEAAESEIVAYRDASWASDERPQIHSGRA